MSSPYQIVIGLEVHVQLLTESKLFCGSTPVFGKPPNSQTCPVCIGMPGVLPVLNRRALELGLKAALALDCKIATFTKWDRKHYFYPDLPKAYQISQYDLPFALGGVVTLNTPEGVKKIRLTRIHLEEDAGKNSHSESGGDSLIDLNRAGTPLLEIVSEPDLRSPADAVLYLETIRTLMRDLDVSDCEMQEGSLRCDANVNIHIQQDGKTLATPITEIKNMNSIRAVERAMHYEAERQYEQWQKDGKLFGQAPKQTRGWDDPRGITRPQREKEEASDYRYFPEPDLPPVIIQEAWLAKARAEMGETSDQRRQRYQDKYGLNAYNADVLVSKGRAVSDYFEELLRLGIEPKPAANWVINDLLSHAFGRLKTIHDLPLAPPALADLIKMVQANKLNLNDAREKVLPEMLENGETAEAVSKRLGLEVVQDTSAVEAIAEEVIAAMPQAVADFKAGKQKAIGSLVGQVMKRGKGKFPPALVNDVLVRKLS